MSLPGKVLAVIRESDMDALSNARITVENSGNGPAPIAFPKAAHSQTGVSVEYAFDPSKRWLVLRASYGRTLKVADMLIGAGHYVYVARRYEWMVTNGHRHRELRDLIPNILFAYIGLGEARTLLSRRDGHPSPLPALASIATFYYNHFETEEGRNPPLVIPDRMMHSFIGMTKSFDENTVFVNDGNIVHVQAGDLVRVREGRFKGCMGQVVRIAGQQRVGLQLADIGWVATSYIPRAFLETVSKEVFSEHLESLRTANDTARAS